MTELALALACGSQAVIWRPFAKEASLQPIQHHDQCMAVAWNHNNKVLASGGAYGRLALHYHNAGLMGVLPKEDDIQRSQVNDLSFSRGSKLIASAHEDGKVQVWDLKHQVRTLLFHALGFAAPSLATVDVRGRVRVLALSAAKRTPARGDPLDQRGRASRCKACF